MTGVPIATAFGDFTAYFSEAGLARLHFPIGAPQGTGSKSRLSDPTQRWLGLTANAVAAILAGRVPDQLPPLDLRIGTEFQQRVWNALCGIHLGEVKSYGEIAREVGSPNGTRAVGTACGANPIPLIVPCHRVVASGGKLGGFSGGLDWKKRLLAIERTNSFTSHRAASVSLAIGVSLQNRQQDAGGTLLNPGNHV